MDDYTDDSVLISNLGGGVLKGFDEIRAMFAAGADMTGWERLVTHVEHEVAYITWKVEGMVDGTDTYVVRDGKITLQTSYVLFAQAATRRLA